MSSENETELCCDDGPFGPLGFLSMVGQRYAKRVDEWGCIGVGGLCTFYYSLPPVC